VFVHKEQMHTYSTFHFWVTSPRDWWTDGQCLLSVSYCLFKPVYCHGHCGSVIDQQL